MRAPYRLLTTTRRPQSRAFTLIELLVVIGIIGALAALLVVAVAGAVRAGRETAIQTEISNLDQSFTEYTNARSGGSYPPNLMTSQMVVGDSVKAMPDTTKLLVLNNFQRHFKKSFPKHREPDALIAALAGVGPSSRNLPGGLNPYEAVVFWLGGFSDNPKYPISGPGGPSFPANGSEDFSSRQPIYDFQTTRLGPRNNSNEFNGRSLRYKVNGINRRINFWYYTASKRTVPYAYFQAPKNPKFDPTHDGVVAVKQMKLNPKNPDIPLIGDIRYANEGKCQILSAGLDDEWGNFAGNMGVDYTKGSSESAPDPMLLYPGGPFTAAIADTISNFSTQRTLEDSQP